MNTQANAIKSFELLLAVIEKLEDKHTSDAAIEALDDLRSACEHDIRSNQEGYYGDCVRMHIDNWQDTETLDNEFELEYACVIAEAVELWNDAKEDNI